MCSLRTSRCLGAIALAWLATLGLSSAARATTVTAQIDGDVVAGVPVRGSVTVQGAAQGSAVWTFLHRGEGLAWANGLFDPTRCPDKPWEGASFMTAAPGSDFTLPFSLDTTHTEEEFASVGRWWLCVIVGPPDAHSTPASAEARFSELLTARAPRAQLAVTAARWHARAHALTFRLRGSSETRGEVFRFLLPGRRRCPQSMPPLLQTPADLGSVGPPLDAAGPFNYSRRVTWRRDPPPPGIYRVCAYLFSDVANILMARSSRPVRVTSR
jgi:hypothetical protein